MKPKDDELARDIAKLVLIIASLCLYVASIVTLTLVNWKIGAGVVLWMWANNLEKQSDKLWLPNNKQV